MDHPYKPKTGYDKAF